MIENVLRFESVRGGDYYNFMVISLHNNGYTKVISNVLGTHSYGLPQKRQRLYMVAFREDCAHMAEPFKFRVGYDQKTPIASTFMNRRLAPRFVNTIRVWK